MAAHQLDGVLLRLRGLTATGGGHASPDRQLLARFADAHDGDAFAALVARHGPMVLGVCRRVLADRHWAEDAFQATFLVLARRAGSVRRPERLGNWLYGVAYRAASRARVEAAKRRARERAAPAPPSPDALAEITARELVEVFDQELHRLPEAYRAAVIACYLRYQTRDEAAAELGWSVATLKRRLERGRALLRARLARRGLAPALFPVVFAPAASAGLPARLAESTVTAAIGFAVSSTPTSPGPVSSTAVLAEGILRTMPTTMQHLAAVLLVAAGLVAGVGMLPLSGAMGGPTQTGAPKPVVAPPDQPMVAADELQGTWTLVGTYKAGKKVAPADVPASHTRLVVAGARVTRHRETSSESGSVEVNPRATPKEFSFTWVAGEPTQLVQKPWVGIYAVDGNSLKLCFNAANGIRPNDFATQPDSERVLFVYQREPATKTDLQRLQGIWELAETRYDGKIVVDNRQGLIAHARIVIDGHWLTLPALREGMAGRRSKVEIDEAATPKRVTFDWYGGPAHGVYTLDGDTFQFCYEHGSKAPPRKFGADPGSKNLLLVYKRQPAAKDGGMDQRPGGEAGPAAGLPKSDLQKLQGTWLLDAVAPDRPAIKPLHSKLEIDGHEFTMHLLDGGSGHHHSKLQINEAANPRRITFDWLGGQAHGIYQIDGDTFTFCYIPGAKVSPPEWGVGPAKLRPKETVVLVYKRQSRPDDEGQPAPALFKGHAAPVSAAMFSADGRTLVTTDTDGMIKVWDARTGEERSTIKRFSQQVTERPARPVTLAVSPDGAALATSVADDVPRLWNAATGRERTVLRREPEAGIAMTFSPDGRTLAFLSASGAVDFWNVDTEVNGRRVRAPQRIKTLEGKETVRPPGVPSYTPSLIFSPEGKRLAVIAPDRTVVLREATTGEELARIAHPVVQAEPKVRNETLLEPLMEEGLRAFGISRPFPFGDVGLAFSLDGETLAIGGAEITFWDARTGNKTGTLPGLPPEQFARLAFSADGKTLTSASPASAPLRVLNVRELWTGETTSGHDSVGVRVRTWELATGRETAAAVIRVYDGARLKPVWQPEVRPRVDFATLSPDLRTMAAAGPDNTARVWDVAAALRPVPADPGQKRRP